MCSNTDHNELFTVISKLATESEVENFFIDLCSQSELDAMTQRLKSAKMLLKGETYENIIKETGISSATLSRISKCVKQGKGYSKHL